MLTHEQKQQEFDNFLTSIDMYSNHLKRFCPSHEDYEKLLSEFKQSNPNKANKKPRVLSLLSREYGFGLTQDNNWAGPIKHFTLRIKHPENLPPMICWPQAFERTSPTTLLFQADDFVPLQDINLLLVGKE